MEIFNLKNEVDKNFQDVLKKYTYCTDRLYDVTTLVQNIKTKYIICSTKFY